MQRIFREILGGRGALAWNPTRVVVKTLGSEAQILGGKQYAYLVLKMYYTKYVLSTIKSLD